MITGFILGSRVYNVKDYEERKYYCPRVKILYLKVGIVKDLDREEETQFRSQ